MHLVVDLLIFSLMTPSLHECQHDFLHSRHFLCALEVRTPHVVVRRRVSFVSGNVPLLFAESAMRSKSLELSLFFSNERFGTLHWKKDSLDFFCHLCIFWFLSCLTDVAKCAYYFLSLCITSTLFAGRVVRVCEHASLLFFCVFRFCWSNFCDFSEPYCKTMTLHMILFSGT